MDNWIDGQKMQTRAPVHQPVRGKKTDLHSYLASEGDVVAVLIPETISHYYCCPARTSKGIRGQRLLK